MKIIIIVICCIQILLCLPPLYLTYIQFKVQYVWYLIFLVLIILVAFGLYQRSKLAYILELLFLFPLCSLLLFQTYRRVMGLFSGIWKDCPPAYFMGFAIEQIIMIPAIFTVVALLLGKHWYWGARGRA